MRPPNDAEIAAREQLCREGEAALAAREARLLALERELGIGEAIEAQPPISEVAGGPRGDHPRDVIPGHSSEATRLKCVARDLLREHGKDAVFMITDRLREAFAPNITLTELQDIGGEDLIITLVQLAAENGVEPPSLLEVSDDAIRACEE